jgi:aromatic-L-amino-acid decarboxylase
MQQTKSRETFALALGDMSAEDFRRHGYALIDWIANYFENIERFDVLSKSAPGDVRRQIPDAPPENGEAIEAIIEDFARIIPPALTHWNHPAFFAYFATSSSAPGIFGELLSAAFDVKAMLWRTSPAATELEQAALDWLRQLMGLDQGFEGIIYDTASVGSMHAIAAAREDLNLRIREEGMSGREDLPLLRVYCSEQAHSSIDKAVIALGLGQRSLRKIPTDDEYCMKPDALAEAIAEDKRNGVVPCCVVATVGTTSTTSIDPVPQIAAVCQREKVWLHIDAAYAGSAAILPEMRWVLDGSEHAASLVTNPHKWLFTPFDLSVLYCRRMDVLRRAFSLVPEYLKTQDEETARNGMDYGIQLGRRFRALKLWFVLRYFGREGIIARIREHCRLAREFAAWVEASEDWERLAPVPFSVVCFRAHPKIEDKNEAERDAQLDALNERIMHAVNASGQAFLSHTKLHDKFTLRLAVGNIRTTERHVRRAWELLNEALQAQFRGGL